ncbi:MAG: hypothetical protein M3253_00975 [Chloroflexota bacterium]|nr:hypothetical protein [Chloroflexota bacterium]
MSQSQPPFPLPPEPAPRSSGESLHPLSMSQIVDLSLRMVRFAWRPLYGAAAAFLVPLYVVLALLEPVIAPPINRGVVLLERWFRQLEALGGATDRPLPPMPVLPAGFWEAIGTTLLLFVVAGVVGFMAGAAVVHAVGTTYQGEIGSARTSVASTFRRGPRLAGAWLAYTLAIVALSLLGAVLAAGLIGAGAGAVAFVGLVVIVAVFAAVVFLFVRWVFVEQTIMLEDRAALEGLGRSWRLVSGAGWRVLGYLLAAGFVLGLLAGLPVSVAMQLLTGGQPTNDPLAMTAQPLLVGLTAILLQPVWAALFTLLYYDVRWRKGELGNARTAAELDSRQQPS